MSRRASFAEFLEAAELPDDPEPVVLSKFPTPRGPAVARGPGRPASNHLRGSSSSRTATAQPAAARRGSRLFSGSLFGGSSLSGAAISSSSRGPVVAPRCEPLIQASAEVEACGKSFGEGQAATHSVSASGAASSFVADVAPQASGPAGPLAAMQHFSAAIANSERGHAEAGSATFETPATPRRKRPVANDDGLLTPALEQKRNVRSMPRWGTDGSEASFAKRRKGHDGESIQAALEDAISAPSFPGGVSGISGREAAQPATIRPEKRSAAFGKVVQSSLRLEAECGQNSLDMIAAPASLKSSGKHLAADISRTVAASCEDRAPTPEAGQPSEDAAATSSCFDLVPYEPTADSVAPSNALGTSNKPAKKKAKNSDYFEEIRGSQLEVVPIVDLMPPTTGGRPKRLRIPPLEFWRGERVIYERAPGSDTVSVKGVVLNRAGGSRRQLAISDKEKLPALEDKPRSRVDRPSKRKLAIEDKRRLPALEDKRKPLALTDKPRSRRRSRRLADDDFLP